MVEKRGEKKVLLKIYFESIADFVHICMTFCQDGDDFRGFSFFVYQKARLLPPGGALILTARFGLPKSPESLFNPPLKENVESC